MRRSTARGVPWDTAPDFDERDLAATFPRLRDLLAGDPMALGTRFAAERLRSPSTRRSPSST